MQIVSISAVSEVQMVRRYRRGSFSLSRCVASIRDLLSSVFSSHFANSKATLE